MAKGNANVFTGYLLPATEQAVLAAGGTREDGLDAVRAYFYEGPIARTISDYHAQKNGLNQNENEIAVI